MTRILLVFIFLSCFLTVKASHVLGGEITWKCNGNGYVFQLTFYRDCNGVDVNPISENIQVWNHPSLSTISVAFVSRTDISPTCNQVAGSPGPFVCGGGSNTGNGIGAIEKIIYRSNPISLNGTPPAGGWIFTYSNFSLNGNVTNIVNPLNFGLTIKATMFALPGGAAGVCSDNSPEFLQDPYLVICSGELYQYNLHPSDMDLDSVVSSFGVPMDRIEGVTYNPPVDPNPVPFEVGFSFTNPTPDASFNAANIPATLNPQTGELIFRSFNTGSYLLKVVAQSFREGVLIAEIEREMQIIVTSCAATNNAPVVPGPFAGLYETTVIAGNPVNFTLTATDVEVLQDGTPQTNYLTASGNEFGTNFTSTSGCDVAPCATLNQTPIISGVQGVSANFSWQTDCAHLVDAAGNYDDMKDFTFVFRVQDNYCQVPKTTFQTITIHVKNPGLIPATTINCISTQPNGDLTISWDPIVDPDGTFQALNLYSVQGGMIAAYPIGTTTATIPNPGNNFDFYVGITSGCAIETFSDTVANVFLDILDPNDGTAVLNWNIPAGMIPNGMNNTCTILREYPAGTWTTIATLPYFTTFFVDTIDICEAQLNYQVVYQTPTCIWNSNTVGGVFKDRITPDIPVIYSASVDTLSGNIQLSWSQNSEPDTYGYVIYWKDANGFVVEIDTVWGIANTTFTHLTTQTGPLTYSVAAFDSCYTPSTPATHQTSAKAELHTTVLLSSQINSCTNEAELSWTDYVGWGTGLTGYTIFARIGGGAWQQVGTASGTTFTLLCTPLVAYDVVVQANGPNGNNAFSNRVQFVVNGPRPPSIHYLRVATVNGSLVTLRHEITSGSNVKAVRFEKFNQKKGVYEILAEIPVTGNTLTLDDPDVDVNAYVYNYRAFVIDSCGNASLVSNVAQTVLLQVTTDQTTLVNHLYWTPYSVFDGGVLSYDVYRGIDGVMDPNPCAVLTPDQRYFEDFAGDFNLTYSGKICYFVIARESINSFGFQEFSVSNTVCPVLKPLVYVPTAFTPGGLNPIFIPVVTFQDVQKYEFSVLDRWGQLIFQTNDPALGWDGVHQQSGELLTSNTYIYVLKVVDGNNQEYYYRGNVTLLR